MVYQFISILGFFTVAAVSYHLTMNTCHGRDSVKGISAARYFVGIRQRQKNETLV